MSGSVHVGSRAPLPGERQLFLGRSVARNDLNRKLQAGGHRNQTVGKLQGNEPPFRETTWVPQRGNSLRDHGGYFGGNAPRGPTQNSVFMVIVTVPAFFELDRK